MMHSPRKAVLVALLLFFAFGIVVSSGCHKGGSDGSPGVPTSSVSGSESSDGGSDTSTLSGTSDSGSEVAVDAGTSENLNAGSEVIVSNAGSASATLTAVALTPANPSCAKGTAVQLTATATYSDNTTRDVTSSVAWSSSNAEIAAVSTAGVVTGSAAGTATITATVGNVSGSCTMSVSAATLVSLSVTPANPQIAKGTTQQFKATGTFSDNSTQDLTTQVSWSSSDATKATITNAGAATGTGVGVTTITATSGGATVSTTLTVTDATLVSIALSPVNAKIALGTSQQFTATGTFTDNSTQDLTAQATWSSTDSTLATISNTSSLKGRASSAATGSVTIRATCGGKTGTTSLTVTAASLVSISITPALVSVPLGLTQQLVATGYYSDNTTQDLTNLVTWISSNSAIASISNSTLLKGLACSLMPGSTLISAVEPFTGTTSAQVTLNVTSAVLQSIAVTPNSLLSKALGLTQQFSAIGTYSDNTTQDITGAVTWLTSNGAVAAISNLSLTRGLLSTLKVGDCQITCVDPVSKIASSPVSLTVTSAVLKSVSITSDLLSTALGLTRQLTAIGTFSDNSTQDITNAVTWLTSNSAVASVSNLSLTKGLLSTLSVGNTQITAVDPVTKLASSPVTFTVTNAVLKAISVTSGVLSTALGLAQQLTALGTFTDNTTQDITNAVTWKSSNGTVASINPLTGLLSTLLVGTTQVTAVDPVTQVASAPVLFTVTNALLKSISLSPINPSLLLGLSKQFKAVGTYTDGTTQDITKAVTWKSSNGLVASISNLTSSKGLASGLLLGTSSISAIDPVSGITSQLSILSILASLLGGLL